jgi:hypothetical protein
MVNIRPDGHWFGFNVEPLEDPPGFRMNPNGTVRHGSPTHTMFNVQPEQNLPGLHNFRPSGKMVPGFHVNADGTGHVLLATSSEPTLMPSVPEPPFLKVVPAEPSPPPAQERPEKNNRLAPPFEFIERLYWPEKGNRLGIPEELMRDPYWRPPEWHSDQIQMDPHGRVLPRQRPWPWQPPGQ